MLDLAQIDNCVISSCEQLNIDNAAVAVIQNRQVVYAQGYGNLRPDIPIPVASLSKPVLTYAVLQLVEQGLLELDRPLADYLPEPYLLNEPFLPLMTARHALCHTTGFPNWREATGLRAMFEPGTAFHYSTEGLVYLQTGVEHITGHPFREWVDERVLRPLHMSDSYYNQEDLSLFLPQLPAGLRAYGGLNLVSTALDYARFVQEMLRLDEGEAWQLKLTTIEEMLRPQTPLGDQAYLAWGLGWGLQLEPEYEPYFWHWGAKRIPTMNFAAASRASGCGVIILTTSRNGLPLCETVAQIALDHPEPLPAIRWLWPPDYWRADGRNP